jgi:hypothetical protein
VVVRVVVLRVVVVRVVVLRLVVLRLVVVRLVMLKLHPSVADAALGQRCTSAVHKLPNASPGIDGRGLMHLEVAAA